MRRYSRGSSGSVSAAAAFLFLGIVLSSLFTGCQTLIDLFAPQPEDVFLSIITTSDVDGAIFEEESETERSGISIAHLKTYLDEKKSDNAYTLLLDNGGFMGNDPLTYYHNYELVGDSHIQASVMNYLSYDAAGLGDTLFGAGHSAFDGLNDDLQLPIIAANVLRESTGEPYFSAYRVLQYGAIRIAVVGFLSPRVMDVYPASVWEGLEVEEIIPAADRWVERIRNTEDPDIIVGLFHQQIEPIIQGSGIEAGEVTGLSSGDAEILNADYSYPGIHTGKAFGRNAEAPNLSMGEILQQIDGFDIVFTNEAAADIPEKERAANALSGNTSGTYDNEAAGGTEGAGGTLVVYTDTQQSFLSEVRITLKWDQRAGTYRPGKIEKVEERSGEDNGGSDGGILAQIPPSPEFRDSFRKELNDFSNYAGRSLGTLTRSLSTRDSLFGDSHAVDLIHWLQMDLTGADVSFAPPPAFNCELSEGETYLRDIFRLPFMDYHLYTIRLSGEEIDRILEYSYGRWYKRMKGPGDNLLRFKDNPQETAYPLKYPYYDFLSASGVEYTVDITREPGERIRITGMAGDRAFQEDQLYVAAVPSYAIHGETAHLFWASSNEPADYYQRIISSTNKPLRYYFINSVPDSGEIRPLSRLNWSIVPESWAAAGRINDEKILPGVMEKGD